jgi:RNA polymerase sigma-70 factor, ECF subfamily
MAVWRIDSKEDFLAFYDASVNAAFRHAMRLTGDRGRAEDLVQDVYVKLLASAGDGRELSVGLVVVAVRNRFIDIVRRVQLEERRLYQLSSYPMCAPEEPEPVLPSVPPRERVALTMKYVEGLSSEEIGRVLECSAAAVDSLLARARRRVRGMEVRDA